MINEEYLRRNLLHAKAVGVHEIAKALHTRAVFNKRAPKWVLNGLREIIERAEPVRAEMVKHRDEAKP